MRIPSDAGGPDDGEMLKIEVIGDGLHELLRRAFVRLGPCNQMVTKFLYESCRDTNGTPKMNG